MLNVEAPVTIYQDTRKALHRLRLRCLCLAPIFLILFVVLSMLPSYLNFVTSSVPPLTGPLSGLLSRLLSYLNVVINILRWVLIAELPILYVLVSRNLARQTKPIVSFSSSGITVNTLGTQVGFLRWEEIKDVYTYNLGFRFVGITLNDPESVYTRIGLKGSWLLRLNGLVIPLYKLFRIHVAPINIAQEYLPMSADELLAQINTCRATYS